MGREKINTTAPWKENKRRIRTTISTINTNEEINIDTWIKREYKKKVKSQVYYNKRSRTRKIEDLKEGDRVWVRALKKYVYVIRKRSEPRAYDIGVE